MSEQAEKLVEEMAFIISEKAEYDIETDLYDGLPTGAEITNVEELARLLITLVGQAYADGMPLPGEEVVRFDFSVDDWGRFENWVAQALHEDASIFIALSPSGITHICSASGCVVALCDDCECPHG